MKFIVDVFDGSYYNGNPHYCMDAEQAKTVVRNLKDDDRVILWAIKGRGWSHTHERLSATPKEALAYLSSF